MRASPGQAAESTGGDQCDGLRRPAARPGAAGRRGAVRCGVEPHRPRRAGVTTSMTINVLRRPAPQHNTTKIHENQDLY